MIQFDDGTTVKKAIEDIYSKHNERKANLDTIKGMPASDLTLLKIKTNSSFSLRLWTLFF